ncbi:MAG: hypothetical protein FJY55_15200 [Betaproteobacteria bacterium]|nr:hypothetical protein [Betaproteobacteria bacterium]
MARSCPAAVLALALVTCLPATAPAETRALVYLGAAHTRSSDLRVNQPSTGSNATFSGVSWRDASFEAPPYYGLRVERFFESRPGWGVGVEFNHYKVHAKTDQAVPVSGTWLGAPVNAVAPLSQRVQNFAISHGVNFIGVSALHQWQHDRSDRFPTSRVQPYLGGGPIFYILHPENTVNNVAGKEKYQQSGFGLHLLGGLHYSVTDRVGVFLELKYTSGTAKVDIADSGNAETRLDTTHGALGLSWRF